MKILHLYMNKMDKKERKDLVREQRKKLKNNPINFFRTEMFEPMIKEWKERPFFSLFIFFKWVFIMYILFAGIQAINNDIIYCDSTIDEYDGKIMYVFNDFVKYYNERAIEMMENNENIDYYKQVDMANSFNEEYSMICEYDLKKWNNESIKDRIGTIWYGFKTIASKR